MKTLYPFQQTAIDKMIQDPGFLLADACGLGKTITAIELAKRLRARGDSEAIWQCLVVVPLSLRAQWEDVLAEQDPGVPVLRSDYIPWDYKQVTGWVIASYTELQSGYAKFFMNIVWDIIIADEAHRLKNQKSVSAQAIKAIPAVRRYALTGTPWERSPGDVWSILNFTRPTEFPSFWQFAKEWLEQEPTYFDAFRYGGPKDPLEFAEMLSNYVIRRTKEEVRPDIPEKIISEIRVDMPEFQQKLYNQLKATKDIIVPVDDKELFIQNVLTLIVRAQQLATDPQLLDLQGTSGKLLWFADFLSDHPHEPIVVFTRFRDTAIRLADKYKGDLIIGGDKGTRFIEGETDLLFATIDSLEGVDGLQRADHAVFLDAHWSSIKMTQALDRIHRINITTVKNIYLLHSCLEDKMVLDAVDSKWTEEELIYHYMKTFDAQPE